MNSQKRKRNIVSYAELDQLPDLSSDDDDITTIPRDGGSGDESENDDRTYSKNKVRLDYINHERFDLLTDPRKSRKSPQR